MRQPRGLTPPHRGSPTPGRFDWRSGMSALQRNWKLAAAIATALLAASPAPAQKAGGVLHMYHRDSPASMSIHEEATFSTLIPVMGVMNNLVMYDQHKAQNSLETIVP